MSEPKYRHVYLSETSIISHRPPKLLERERRYTCTESPEWDALMERAQIAITDDYDDYERFIALRDLLAYFGEQNDGR